MKNNNVIDMTAYFKSAPQSHQEDRIGTTVKDICHIAGRVLDIAFTAAIAICVVSCTLLFLTML